MSDEYLRNLLIEGLMPDWVRDGGYSADSAQGKTETLLRDMDGRVVDQILAIFKANGLHIVGTGAKVRPQPPTFA